MCVYVDSTEIPHVPPDCGEYLPLSIIPTADVLLSGQYHVDSIWGKEGAFGSDFKVNDLHKKR